MVRSGEQLRDLPHDQARICAEERIRSLLNDVGPDLLEEYFSAPVTGFRLDIRLISPMLTGVDALVIWSATWTLPDGVMAIKSQDPFQNLLSDPAVNPACLYLSANEVRELIRESRARERLDAALSAYSRNLEAEMTSRVARWAARDNMTLSKCMEKLSLLPNEAIIGIFDDVRRRAGIRR